MRKFIAFLFISFLIWNYAGFYGYFHLESLNLRKELKTKLKLSYPKEDLRDFTFSKNEIANLTWTKRNEFVWRSNMYDVVYSDTSEKGDSIHYQCISDVQETLLFARLDCLISNDLSGKGHPPIFVYKAQNIQAVVPVHEWLKQEKLSKVRNESLSFKPYQFSILSHISELQPKPPKKGSYFLKENKA